MKNQIARVKKFYTDHKPALWLGTGVFAGVLIGSHNQSKAIKKAEDGMIPYYAEEVTDPTRDQPQVFIGLSNGRCGTMDLIKIPTQK